MKEKHLDFMEVVGKDVAEDNAKRIFKVKYDNLLKQKEFFIPESVKGETWMKQLVWLERYARENGLNY
jgi:hypothetical protein